VGPSAAEGQQFVVTTKANGNKHRRVRCPPRRQPDGLRRPARRAAAVWVAPRGVPALPRVPGAAASHRQPGRDCPPRRPDHPQMQDDFIDLYRRWRADGDNSNGM